MTGKGREHQQSKQTYYYPDKPTQQEQSQPVFQSQSSNSINFEDIEDMIEPKRVVEFDSSYQKYRDDIKHQTSQSIVPEKKYEDYETNFALTEIGGQKRMVKK